MRTTLIRTIFPLAVFALLISAFLPGCGGASATVEEVCTKCTTGSRAIQTCIEQTTKDRDVLQIVGCGPEVQDLLDCLLDEGACLIDNGSSASACASDRIAALNCADIL